MGLRDWDGDSMTEIRGEVVREKRTRGAAKNALPWPEKKSSKSAAGSERPGEEHERERTQGQAVATEKPEKRTRGNGLKRLQKAADRRLARASEALADLLLEKAQEGKLDSARLLVSLAEHRQDRKDRKPKEKKPKKREGPSWAELLVSEPEWEEEKPEVGDVWVGDGWKKQGTGEIVKSSLG